MMFEAMVALSQLGNTVTKLGGVVLFSVARSLVGNNQSVDRGHYTPFARRPLHLNYSTYRGFVGDT